MAKIVVEANQCDACGYVWLPSGKVAVQCAKCRTRKWDNSKVQDFLAMPNPLSDRLMEVSAMSDALGIKRSPYPGAPPKSSGIPERTIEYEE